MIIPQRYIVRMFNIPDNMTQIEIEENFTDRNLTYKKIFFASTNGQYSAGFAFIEFDSREQLNLFKSCFINVNDDIIYNNGKQL
jgi:hypothetical protein